MDKIALGKVVLDAARLLFSDGGAGWVVAFLLGAACWHLYRETQRAQEARIGDASAIATALERASQTNTAVAAALESRSRVMEDLSRLVGEVARGIDRNDERTRARLDEILRRFADLQREHS